MKCKYFICVLIILLGLSNVAFGQTLIILKDGRGIEVTSAQYDNNQCIYIKNGSEFRIPLNLVEEIYVLNKGTIYPPQHCETPEKQPNKIINDKQETYQPNKITKKSEHNTSISDIEEPVERTYIYKPLQGFFQCKIPKSWNYNEMNGVHMFTPFSFNEDFSKTMIQILRSLDKVHVSALSRDHKVKILKGMENIWENLLAERVRQIGGIEAWETLYESHRYKAKKMHQVMLIHDGFLVSITLEASPELYESADRQFERIIESLEFF